MGIIGQILIYIFIAIAAVSIPIGEYRYLRVSLSEIIVEGSGRSQLSIGGGRPEYSQLFCDCTLVSVITCSLLIFLPLGVDIHVRVE